MVGVFYKNGDFMIIMLYLNFKQYKAVIKKPKSI